MSHWGQTTRVSGIAGPSRSSRRPRTSYRCSAHNRCSRTRRRRQVQMRARSASKQREGMRTPTRIACLIMAHDGARSSGRRAGGLSPRIPDRFWRSVSNPSTQASLGRRYRCTCPAYSHRWGTNWPAGRRNRAARIRSWARIPKSAAMRPARTPPDERARRSSPGRMPGPTHRVAGVLERRQRRRRRLHRQRHPLRRSNRHLRPRCLSLGDWTRTR